MVAEVVEGEVVVVEKVEEGETIPAKLVEETSDRGDLEQGLTQVEEEE